MKLLSREMELMREHIKKKGIGKLLTVYAFVFVLVIIIETFASYNLYLLGQTHGQIPLLREIFSATAIVVAAFTVIANVVFMGGRTKSEREFIYYFRTRPLVVLSSTAILGDIVAVFLHTETGHGYIIFFTSLIALNLLAVGFAVYGSEKAIEGPENKKNTRKI